MSYTKGPWTVYCDHYDGPIHRIEIVALGKTVARIYTSVPEQDMDNARLIASAPELLEALKGLYADQVDYLTINHLGGMDNHWMKAARAAISKAEGKS